MSSKAEITIPELLDALIESLREGKSLNHFSSIALASYALMSGHTVNEVVRCFSHLPGFDSKHIEWLVQMIYDNEYLIPQLKMRIEELEETLMYQDQWY